MEKERISKNIKKEGTIVLTRVILFLVYYVALIAIGFLLLVGAALVTFSIPTFLEGLDRINIRLLIIGTLALVAMWWFCIQIGFYLIKPLFISPKVSNDDRLEIIENDCPKLFSMIQDVAHATGNRMPKHVYLSSEVNACVFYDKASIWSVFLPTRKNLMIGIGLLHGMNTSEVKAILSHEFGHFSQQSMRVGTVTYRLLLIIRTMIDHAQKQQQRNAIARSQENYKWYLHLAVYPISFITKRTIAFYNWIEKENRNLSRYMELEADSVACKVVDAKSFISSLCKLVTLSNRFSVYENVIANTLSKRQYLKEYWQGYIFVYEQLSKSENLYIENDTLLEAPVGDNSRYPSRVTILNGWNTHPTLLERIDNASQFKCDAKKLCLDLPYNMVGIKILNQVGEIHQHFIENNLQSPISWQSLSVINLNEFKNLFMTTHRAQLEHFSLSAFLNKRIHSFAFPDEKDIEAENIINPFTETNRNIILQYNQEVKDWQILNQIKSGEIDSKKFLYDNKLYSDADEPLTLQKERLDSLFKRWCKLDIEVYKFLWKNVDNRQGLDVVYWTIMYANDALDALDPLRQKTEEIKERLEFYHSIGSEVTINDELRNALSSGIWKFLQHFNFDTVLSIFGNVTSNDIPLSTIMDKWKSISLLKQPPYLDDSELINIIGEISGFLDYMFNTGNNQWKTIVIQTYDSCLNKKVSAL